MKFILFTPLFLFSLSVFSQNIDSNEDSTWIKKEFWINQEGDTNLYETTHYSSDNRVLIRQRKSVEFFYQYDDSLRITSIISNNGSKSLYNYGRNFSTYVFISSDDTVVYKKTFLDSLGRELNVINLLNERKTQFTHSGDTVKQINYNNQKKVSSTMISVLKKEQITYGLLKDEDDFTDEVYFFYSKNNLLLSSYRLINEDSWKEIISTFYYYDKLKLVYKVIINNGVITNKVFYEYE